MLSILRTDYTATRTRAVDIIEVDWLQNVTSKLSSRSNVNSKEKKSEEQKELLSICCEFKIVKRRLVENVGLIRKCK
jgi:hypothetical protein